MTTKDFTSSMTMWEFFAENPHYRLMEYAPIKNGIRAWYVILQ